MQVCQLQETFCERLLACLNFTLGSEGLFYWYKRKKGFLWTIAAAHAAENHGDECGLTRYLPWGIYTSVSTWTHSQNSLAVPEADFKDILPWNISQMIRKIIPISRIVISHAMKRGILFWVYWKVNGSWENNMIRISQWRESHCRTNTSIRKKK